MAKRSDVAKEIKSVLDAQLHSVSNKYAFKTDVSPSGYKDYVHVWVVSDFFKKIARTKRNRFIWDLLDGNLPKRKLVKITMLSVLTEKEESMFLSWTSQKRNLAKVWNLRKVIGKVLSTSRRS